MKALLDQIAVQIEAFQKESAAHSEGNKAASLLSCKATLELTKII